MMQHNYHDSSVDDRMAESFSDYTLVAEAIFGDQKEELRSILDRAGPKLVNRVGRCRNELTLLHLAVRVSNCSIIQILLERGFDVNARDNFDQTPLHCSLERSDDQICQLLLDNGADVNLCDCWGRAPLHKWEDQSAYFQPSRIELLIERGANLEARDFLRGYTPLHYATECGSQEGIEILLNRGANIEACTRRRSLTPLHLAVMLKNQVKLIKLLLDRGADIEALDVEQATPLHLASRDISGYRSEARVRSLLKRGANINARNIFNNTPLLLAILDSSYPIVKAILEHQPDVNDERVLSLSLGLLESEKDVYATRRRQSGHEALIAYGFTLHNCEPVGELFKALERVNYPWAKRLINRGMRSDQVQDNGKFLIQAMDYRRKDFVELLVKTGVSVNSIGPCTNPHEFPSWSRYKLGRAQWIPSASSIAPKISSILRTLFDNEADPPRDWCLSGIEQLSWLIDPHRTGTPKIELIELLLKHGAYIDFPDPHKNTQLDEAFNNSNRNLVRMLLINGADVNNGHSTLKMFSHLICPTMDLINKLHIAGSYVSDYNIYLLERLKMDNLRGGDRTYQSHLKKDEIYRGEVSKLKKLKLLNGVSLHRIFITEDFGYVSNQDLMDELEFVDFDEFPEYGDSLRGKLKRDKKQNENFSRAREAFNFLVLVRSTIKKDTCKRLLQELVTKIISQLSKFDHRNLTLCGDDLKKQLLGNKRKR